MAVIGQQVSVSSCNVKLGWALLEGPYEIKAIEELTMEAHGLSGGFTLVRTHIRFSVASRSCCACVNLLGGVSPIPLTLKSPQSVKNQGLWRNPRVCIRGKYVSTMANAYNREGKSSEEAGSEVESPNSAKLEEKAVSSQTATVEEKGTDSLEEIGKALKEVRNEKSSDTDFWRGALEEATQIEWPPFQRVLGTTGLVLAVIVGSSVVLLTVNAILAELSDKIFDGIGVQDILWGASK